MDEWGVSECAATRSRRGRGEMKSVAREHDGGPWCSDTGSV